MISLSTSSKLAPRCRELRRDILRQRKRAYLRAGNDPEYEQAARLLYELSVNASMMELIRITADDANRDRRSYDRDFVRLRCACIYI